MRRIQILCEVQQLAASLTDYKLMRARQLITKLRPAGGLALVGLLGWTTADALNEALVYRECQRFAHDGPN